MKQQISWTYWDRFMMLPRHLQDEDLFEEADIHGIDQNGYDCDCTKEQHQTEVYQWLQRKLRGLELKYLRELS